MYIEFGWGQDPADEAMFEVARLELNLEPEKGRDVFGNCCQGSITVDFTVPEVKDPGKNLFDYAAGQYSRAAEEGAGVVRSYRQKGAGQILQSIEFSEAYISNMKETLTPRGNDFGFSISVKAAVIRVGGVEFFYQPLHDTVNQPR